MNKPTWWSEVETRLGRRDSEELLAWFSSHRAAAFCDGLVLGIGACLVVIAFF